MGFPLYEGQDGTISTSFSSSPTPPIPRDLQLIAHARPSELMYAATAEASLTYAQGSLSSYTEKGGHPVAEGCEKSTPHGSVVQLT